MIFEERANNRHRRARQADQQRPNRPARNRTTFLCDAKGRQETLIDSLGNRSTTVKAAAASRSIGGFKVSPATAAGD